MTLLVGSIFHMTRKIVSEMTYNVSSGTLNSTNSTHTNKQTRKLGVNLITSTKKTSTKTTIYWCGVVLLWCYLLCSKIYMKSYKCLQKFLQYLSSTCDDFNYWVYVLTLEVITGVCNLTWQGRLQKTTTTAHILVGQVSHFKQLIRCVWHAKPTVI